MLASVWVPLLVGGVVFFSLVVASVLIAATLLWRFALRRWRMICSHRAVVGAGLLWTAISDHLGRPPPPVAPADLAGQPARKVRREILRSVGGAEAAVRAADDLGGPTASLPSLCRRLRYTADRLDRVLRVEPDGATSPELAGQAFDLMRAAGDVHRAAMASAGSATGHQLEALTRDADHEMAALDAGLASSRELGLDRRA